MTPEEKTSLLEAIENLRIATGALCILLEVHIPILATSYAMQDIKNKVNDAQKIIGELKK